MGDGCSLAAEWLFIGFQVLWDPLGDPSRILLELLRDFFRGDCIGIRLWYPKRMDCEWWLILYHLFWM